MSPGWEFVGLDLAVIEMFPHDRVALLPSNSRGSKARTFPQANNRLTTRSPHKFGSNDEGHTQIKTEIIHIFPLYLKLIATHKEFLVPGKINCMQHNWINVAIRTECMRMCP